jgi:hypothetical protein
LIGPALGILCRMFFGLGNGLQFLKLKPGFEGWGTEAILKSRRQSIERSNNIGVQIIRCADPANGGATELKTSGCVESM